MKLNFIGKINEQITTLILETANMELHHGLLQNRDSDFQHLFVSMKWQLKPPALHETSPRFKAALAVGHLQHREDGKTPRLSPGGSPPCVYRTLIFMLLWWWLALFGNHSETSAAPRQRKHVSAGLHLEEKVTEIRQWIEMVNLVFMGGRVAFFLSTF